MAKSRVFLALPEEKRLLYAATPTSWKDFELYRALSVSTTPVFAYKAIVIVDVDVNIAVSKEKEV